MKFEQGRGNRKKKYIFITEEQFLKANRNRCTLNYILRLKSPRIYRLNQK